MNRDAAYLKKTYENNEDFILRDVSISKKQTIYIAYFESLCSQENIYKFVLKNIYERKNLNDKFTSLKDIIASPKLNQIKESEECFNYLENGFVVVIHENEKYAIEVKAELDRGIQSAETEPNMYGAKDAFCENYQKNLGLIKRRIKSKTLKTDSAYPGNYTKTKVSILYLEEKVEKNTIQSVKVRLNSYKDKDILDSSDVENILENGSIFPTILKTEKPSLVAKYLLKGYVIIILDNAPFALILDAKLKDFINPSTTDKFIKVLRYVCFFLTILTPAIYIALLNFNQETIPTSLLISFSEQRSGVPFPAIIEAFLMLLVCEILRECDIRFPNAYGSAASILGALILGDAAVSAGIVSPIMIIIIAITFITSLIFTEIKFVSAIRIFRIGFLLISCFLGLYGVSIGLIAALSILSNVKLNEGTYI